MGRAKLTAIWGRIYSDFFMPSKLPDYKDFLHQFITFGYRVCPVRFLWQQIRSGELNRQRRYLVLRHDVDTDTATARAMWKIEADLGLTSSYFFRLSTIDVPFMQEIHFSGGEASYHFEEVATVAKQRHLKTREAVLQNMPYIRDTFKRNLNLLRAKTGIPMKIVAAHGDFVNRILRFYNWEILTEESFRKDVEVELEVYDEAFMRHVTSRHSELLPPRLWRPDDPLEAAERGNSIIYILVHPRNWRVNRKENLKDNVNRLWEGLRYSL